MSKLEKKKRQPKTTAFGVLHVPNPQEPILTNPASVAVNTWRHLLEKAVYIS